jgi:hypothetical protein
VVFNRKTTKHGVKRPVAADKNFPHQALTVSLIFLIVKLGCWLSTGFKQQAVEKWWTARWG